MDHVVEEKKDLHHGSASRLQAMIEEEKEIRRNADHGRLIRLRSRCCPCALWRERVVQWFYDVVDHIGESRDRVFVAANILDRYIAMSKTSCNSERTYESAALTALFLAIRISASARLEVFDLIRMSRSGIRVREIVSCGKEMTSILSWDLPLLTPTDFVKAAGEALPRSVDAAQRRAIVEDASYAVEASVCDSFFVGMKPSMLALAAVMNSINGSKDSGMSDFERTRFADRLAKFAGTNVDDEGLSLVRTRMNQVRNASMRDDRKEPHLIIDEGEDVNYNGQGLESSDRCQQPAEVESFQSRPFNNDSCSVKRSVSLSPMPNTKRRRISS